MGNTARGKHALFISDRSGLQYPYSEMVKEWNGARVHISEYEPKQPQLEPKPYTADPQGLQHPRPARLELPTPDLLEKNPFTTSDVFIDGDRTAVYVVTQPNSGILVNDVVRLMSIKSNLSSSTTALQISIQALELSTTLQSSITSTDTSLAVVDNLGFYRDGGYVVIEKINSTTGFFENEVIQYTAYDSSTKVLSGLVRGTNAPFRGVKPKNTTASSHDAGAKIFGARLVDSLNETTQSQAGQPSTITIANSYNLKENDEGTFFIDTYGPGGGLNCLAGPVNNNFTSTNL